MIVKDLPRSQSLIGFQVYSVKSFSMLICMKGKIMQNVIITYEACRKFACKILALKRRES